MYTDVLKIYKDLDIQEELPSAITLNYLGILYNNMGRLEDAIICFNQAIKIRFSKSNGVDIITNSIRSVYISLFFTQ